MPKELDTVGRSLRAARYWAGKVAYWAVTPQLLPHRVRHLRHLWELRRINRARTPSRKVPAAETPAREEAAFVRHAQTAGRIGKQYAPPVIVVPVYNAPEETDACIRSVLRHTDRSIRLLLIDDGSPDGAVADVLARYGGVENVTLVRNDVNLGFTRTVNRGIELAGRSDVVLLNSDTQVTPLWLGNLRLAAYSGDRVATATPFSDNAGAFSAPEVGKKNALPEGSDLDGYARLVTRTAERLYPETPTGNGFCLYVRRDCLDEIGAFDAEAFPRGYGEENDFCMRALRAGWTHVVDDATLIHHIRSVSFGEAKTELMKQGRATIDERFPDYTRRVRDFIADSRMAAARANVGKAMSLASRRKGAKPRLLYVIATKTGGTPQTNEDLMAALHGRYETFLLRCDSNAIEFSEVVGREHRRLEWIRLDEPVRAFPHISSAYDRALRWLLSTYAIELVHIRHIAWHGLTLPAICRQLHLPVVFSFHDYYTICPTVKLLDENLRFCAGRCTPTSGECKHELWVDPAFPPLKHRAIHGWQAAMGAMLEHCDSFVTTSPFAREQIAGIYPEILRKPFRIIPHGRDLDVAKVAAPPPRAGEKIRILVPGNIGVPKGALILEQLDKSNTSSQFEFHVLGNTNIQARGGIVFHGPYVRDQFAAKAAAIQPHFGMILSIWPETYCHTLTELWSCGIPVVALDFGAVGERIREYGGGWLLPDGDPARIMSELERLAWDEASRSERLSEISRWQAAAEREETTAAMAAEYDTLYERLFERRRPSPSGMVLDGPARVHPPLQA